MINAMHDVLKPAVWLVLIVLTVWYAPIVSERLERWRRRRRVARTARVQHAKPYNERKER